MAGEAVPTEIADLIEHGVLIINDGYRAKNIELGDRGLPFARGGNIDGGFHFDTADRFPEENLDRVGEKVSRPGDAVFTSKGTVGRFAFVGEDVPRFVYSPQLCFWRSLDYETINPRWLFYWMHSAEFFGQYSGVKGQTDMADYVSLRDQRQMQITLPLIDEQRAIAEILGSLDDKIELNRRMNETFEAMARAIFKAWFIDFLPVKAKAAGATSFRVMPQDVFDLLPNQLTDSELGPIPEGWEIGSLGDVMEHPRRPAKPHEVDPHTPYIGLEHMPRRCIALSDWGEVGSVTSNKHRFYCGELLFGKLRPYFHKVGIAPVDGVCSTDVVVVRPKTDAWFGFVLGHLSSDAFVAYTNAASTGTKMPRTNWKDMSRFAVAAPPEIAARAFTDLIGPLIKRITDGINESRTLAAIRDTLLPKLLSGEIRVPTLGAGL